ncbi:MAG TPA: SpoIIE family protein phosphatase [Pseudacidobacterium sp.]|jgi:serine phosphatase RsbU (regulator of sigma subunit)|nr:SpoIIE family protein phosphatase [Pseudacidobacterium sp.]
MREEKSSPRLVIRDTEQSRTVPIDQFPFTIGRHPGHALFLQNSRVSREHAVINKDDAGYLIQDLGSRHGTFVNGHRIETARLTPGDHIQLGPSQMVLLFLDGEDESTARIFLNRLSSQSEGSEIEKLSLFLQAAQSFNNTRVLHDVLSTMVEYTLKLTCAERGFVFLGESPQEFRLECGRNQDGTPLMDDSTISRSIVRDAGESRSEFIIGDVTGGGQALGRESIIVHELLSVIAIPLRRRNSDQLLGLLYLDSRLHKCDLSAVSKDILHAIAIEASTLLENARMVQAEQKAALLRKEMEIAAAIQHRIISRELPSLSHASVAAKTMPCKEVGGDFYDVIPEQDGFVAMVADVSGKGMPAALLASIVHGMMYAQITSGASLTDTVNAVNGFLCERMSGDRYVTLVVLRYRNNGEIEIVNAGHVPPYIVLNDGHIEEITDGDLPVGLMSGVAFHPVRFSLPLQARVVLLSDGVTEAEDAAGAQFGADKLQTELSAVEPVSAIFSAIQLFSNGAPPEDDRTLLVIDRIA